MVCTPPPAMPKAIVDGPLAASASWIAARSVHSPALAVTHTPLRLASPRSATELTRNVRGVPAATRGVPAGSAGAVVEVVDVDVGAAPDVDVRAAVVVVVV